MNLSPLFHSSSSRACRHSKGFTLIEVAIALGIFGFSIVPVVGLMGLGLNVSKESSDASTMTQIYRQVEALTINSGTALYTSGTTLYFSNDGDQDATPSHANTIYQAVVSETTATDAAQGLLARGLWQVTIVRPANPHVILSQRILQFSKAPVELAWN